MIFEFLLECVYIIHVGHYKNMYYEHYWDSNLHCGVEHHDRYLQLPWKGIAFPLIVVKTAKRGNDNKRIAYLCSRKGLKTVFKNLAMYRWIEILIMTQIKLFTEKTPELEKIEKQINAFLKDNDGKILVKDINILPKVQIRTIQFGRIGQ